MPSGVYKRIIGVNAGLVKGRRWKIKDTSKWFGRVSWNKGKKYKNPKVSIANKGKPTWNKGVKMPEISGERHYYWKGDKVKYFGVHVWVRNVKGKASKCENPDCVYPRKNRRGYWMLKPSRFEWANIDYQYRRAEEDYISLCVSCHRLYDLGK